MARTTEALVRGILNLTTESVSDFITIANALIDTVADHYSAKLLELMERYLSAHFYTLSIDMAKGGESETKTGDLTSKLLTNPGKYYESTTYGQQVVAMDTLKKLGGSETSSQTKGWYFALL